MVFGEHLMHKLTRVHLWVGEHLGLTRYTSCWTCEHSCVVDESPDVCGCVATEDDHACMTIVCCSEAVWCPNYVWCQHYKKEEE